MAENGIYAQRLLPLTRLEVKLAWQSDMMEIKFCLSQPMLKKSKMLLVTPAWELLQETIIILLLIHLSHRLVMEQQVIQWQMVLKPKEAKIKILE